MKKPKLIRSALGLLLTLSLALPPPVFALRQEGPGDRSELVQSLTTGLEEGLTEKEIDRRIEAMEAFTGKLFTRWLGRNEGRQPLSGASGDFQLFSQWLTQTYHKTPAVEASGISLDQVRRFYWPGGNSEAPPTLSSKEELRFALMTHTFMQINILRTSPRPMDDGEILLELLRQVEQLKISHLPSPIPMETMEKTFLILDLLQSAKRLVGLPPALLMGGSEWIVHQEMRNGTTLDRGAEKASRIIGSFLVGFLGTKKVEATDSLLVLVVGPDGKRMVLSLPTRGIEPGDWIESLLKKVFEKKGLADKPPDGWRITVYGPFNLSDSPGLILAGIRQLPRPYLVFELSRPDAFQVEPPLGAGLEEERLLDTGT